jgi:hypothetical protein
MSEDFRKTWPASDSKDGQTPEPLIVFKIPGEIMSAKLDPDALLVGDNHITKGEIFLVAGAPAVGKSRSTIALAESGAFGYNWFDLPVHRKFKTMVIQNENGLHRLKSELAELDCSAMDTSVRISLPGLGLPFGREDFRACISSEIAAFQPDVVIIDPWNAVSLGDKQLDYVDAIRQLRQVIPPGTNSPALGIVVHTRKPKEGPRSHGRIYYTKYLARLCWPR